MHNLFNDEALKTELDATWDLKTVQSHNPYVYPSQPRFHSCQIKYGSYLD